MNNSLAIGDSLRDLEAAYFSGIKKRILISEKDLNSKFITHRFNNISDCAKYIFIYNIVVINFYGYSNTNYCLEKS